MSGTNHSGKAVSVDAQALETAATERSAGDTDAVVEPEAETRLRPSVEQTTQATVDANHPEGLVQDPQRLTLAQEERRWAREQELAHISSQATLTTQDGRAQRTRRAVVERQRERGKPGAHAGAVEDPRERLDPETLARVNEQAERIADELDNAPHRAAVGRVLATEVLMGKAMPEAVFETLATCRARMGAVCPISEVPELDTQTVTVEGRIEELWPPGDGAIAWVGLIADESGQTKVTAWEKSRVRTVEEGERVRLCDCAVNWYRGRWSLALTGDSQVVVQPDDG